MPLRKCAIGLFHHSSRSAAPAERLNILKFRLFPITTILTSDRKPSILNPPILHPLLYVFMLRQGLVVSIRHVRPESSSPASA